MTQEFYCKKFYEVQFTHTLMFITINSQIINKKSGGKDEKTYLFFITNFYN